MERTFLRINGFAKNRFIVAAGGPGLEVVMLLHGPLQVDCLA
jgi:hypothetical protein